MKTGFPYLDTRFARIGALLVGLAVGLTVGLTAGCSSDMDPGPDPDPDLGDPVIPEREAIDPTLTAEPERLKVTTLRGTAYLGNSTGASGCDYDYSHYEADTTGTQLHVVGIYEPSDGTGGNVRVHVSRAGDSVLVLSAYESTTWVVTAEPGVTLERIILTGYNTHSVIAPAGVPLVQVDQLGFYSDHRWPSFGTSHMVDASESYTGLSLSSFRGCYNSDSFEIADVGTVEPPHIVTTHTEPSAIPGCESITTENAYCLTFNAFEFSATMMGLDSETSCGSVPLPTEASDYSSLAWIGDYVYTCHYDLGLIRMSLVDGSVDVAPLWCEAVTSYNDGLLAFVALEPDFPMPQVVHFNSFDAAARRAPTHIFDLDPYASRVATNGEQAYYSWHAADEVLTSELLDGAPITPISLAGYDDWIMGLDVLDDGRLLIGGQGFGGPDLFEFDVATGAAITTRDFPDLDGVSGLDCASAAPLP